MKQVNTLIAKEYRVFWKDKVAVSLTFIVPVVLIFIFGSVFGGASTGPKGMRLAFLNQSDAHVATKIEHSLDTMAAFRLVRSYRNEQGLDVPFDTASIKAYVRNGNAVAALVFPPDAYADTSLGLKIDFYYDPKNDIEMSVTEGIVQRTVMKEIPSFIFESMRRSSERYLGQLRGKQFNGGIDSLVRKYFGDDAADAITNFSLDSLQARAEPDSGFNLFENMVQINKQQLVGTEVESPWATRSVGGWAMMFLLFAVTGSASSLFDEKKSGVVLRILASPISRTQILWSKYLFNMSLGFIQLIFLFVAGWVLFDINIFANFFTLAVVVFAAATACTAFGMLLAAFSKTAAQANGWGTFLILTMSAVGGAWFPTSFMPQYVQVFSKLTIVYWSMEGFLDALWRRAGLFDVLPEVGVLLGIALLVNTISVVQFKKGHVF